MEYQRFLRDEDYKRSISDQHFNQCFDTKNKPYKVSQCEMDAEIKMIEYLSQMYDIEGELAKGKSISNYDKRILYSEGSFFWDGGKICRAIRDILGAVRPERYPHWSEVELADDSEVPVYSQFSDYSVGEFVKRKGICYQCLEDNGYSYDNIRVPSLSMEKYWEYVPSHQWVFGENHPLNTIVEYYGSFYMLSSLDGYDSGISPDKLTSCFTPIQAHTDNIVFNIGDYSSFEGNAFKCLRNVNADTPELRKNIVYSDPRNHNLVKHLVEISLYYAFKEFSPNNISSVRITSYEEAEKWLKDAAKLRIDPRLDRKKDSNNKDAVPFATGNFVNSSQYKDNNWSI